MGWWDVSSSSSSVFGDLFLHGWFQHVSTFSSVPFGLSKVFVWVIFQSALRFHRLSSARGAWLSAGRGAEMVGATVGSPVIVGPAVQELQSTVERLEQQAGAGWIENRWDRWVGSLVAWLVVFSHEGFGASCFQDSPLVDFHLKGPFFYWKKRNSWIDPKRERQLRRFKTWAKDRPWWSESWWGSPGSCWMCRATVTSCHLLLPNEPALVVFRWILFLSQVGDPSEYSVGV